MRNAQHSSLDGRQCGQGLFDVQHEGVWVRHEIPYDVDKHVPLDLRKPKKQMGAGQLVVTTPLGLAHRAIEDTLRLFIDLSDRDIQELDKRLEGPNRRLSAVTPLRP